MPALFLQLSCRQPPSQAPGLSVATSSFLFSCFCFFSHKFGKKVTYFNYLSELREYLKDDQLTIPPEVLRYDVKLQNLPKGPPPLPARTPPPRPPLPTQQFGVSLQ